MNKADSLERLAHWAQWGAPFADGSLNEMDDAVSHGAAAVRLVRDVRACTNAIPCPSPLFPHVYNESRAAVRAALDAVGICGAL